LRKLVTERHREELHVAGYGEHVVGTMSRTEFSVKNFVAENQRVRRDGVMAAEPTCGEAIHA
jgi:hypothetical protein